MLTRLAVVEATRSKPHALVEALEITRFVLEPELTKVTAQRVQRLGHRIATREVVSLEQRLEDRPRQDVLRHHVDSVPSVDGLVNRNLELIVERFEPFAQGLVVGIVEQPCDPRHEAGENVRHVPGPCLPVFSVAALLNDLGVDRARRQVERRERQYGRIPFIVSVNPVAGEDDPVRRRVVEVDLVDLRVEPIVVRPKSAQHAPDGGEALVVVER